VAAFEGDAAAAAALLAAVNRHGLAGRVTVERRDLVRRPLADKELAGFAAVVLDPPHAGAEPQITRIAAARVGHVVYVSCNPAALARDAAILHRAGYAVSGAVPIDQFVWSSRLESVVAFSRV
jgi:23S rRNA (uracil1939-C5)-methyltransferase